MPSWMNSIRAIAVILSFGLLYTLLIGSFFGKEVNATVIGLVASVVTGVVVAYFGKRDETKKGPDDSGDQG